MQIVRTYRFNKNEHVDNYYWVNNERLVYTRKIKSLDSETFVTYGQIYAGNIDGSKRSIIFGYQGGVYSNSRAKKNRAPERSHGEIIHTLPDDSEHILISARNMDNDLDAPMRVIKLNVYNSKKKLVTKTPFGNMKVVFNRAGVPIIARGYNAKGEVKLYFYQNGNWVGVKDSNPLSNFNPLFMSEKEDNLYLTGYSDNSTKSLYEYNLENKKIRLLFSHTTADIHEIITEPDTNVAVGVKLVPGYMEYQYIEPNSSFSMLHRMLVASFKNSDVRITSRTRNKKEMVVLVKSDTRPGDFYIFNTEKKSVDYLLSKKRWVEPELMAEKKPIKFKSRDKATIYGYLTIPKSDKNNKKYPLVTLVHGGPYGQQDLWDFDADTQMLANNGYAVLQVNYRGSGGYGLDYKKVAYQKRSSLIQQDIIDGTRWALQQPEINKTQVCIMGWSFGGYSALMASLLEPELFKCSIAAAGVYDAVVQEKSADYSNISSTSSLASSIYGNDQKLLKKESPLTYIDNLKTPVFIVHGGEDKRVPPEQAYKLKAALEKRNMPFEWLLKEREGHGFYKLENRVEFYQKALAFLKKNLSNN
ncbi:alpha/beta hydrolase family protein [Aliikangiella sp. IMCC44359]|uniref:alpha/beta hydrolase family protein n=1 Tax=Aliikangiella sp. IMCC44359 TaxID=3459125 RepID=UPI00403AFCB0